jgi:hypothetical protein
LGRVLLGNREKHPRRGEVEWMMLFLALSPSLAQNILEDEVAKMSDNDYKHAHHDS